MDYKAESVMPIHQTKGKHSVGRREDPGSEDSLSPMIAKE
jgi:hypothetical protein